METISDRMSILIVALTEGAGDIRMNVLQAQLHHRTFISFAVGRTCSGSACFIFFLWWWGLVEVGLCSRHFVLLEISSSSSSRSSCCSLFFFQVFIRVLYPRSQYYCCDCLLSIINVDFRQLFDHRLLFFRFWTGLRFIGGCSNCFGTKTRSILTLGRNGAWRNAQNTDDWSCNLTESFCSIQIRNHLAKRKKENL